MDEEQHRMTNEILKLAVTKELFLALDQVVIINFKVSSGANVGDGLATEVKLVTFQYRLHGQEKSHSYIFKQVPINAFREKLLRNVGS